MKGYTNYNKTLNMDLDSAGFGLIAPKINQPSIIRTTLLTYFPN